MMQDVVLFGTARRALLNGYTAAGKTGTAQKVDPNTHRYSATDYVGSFVGFAPVNTPAISIAVILDSAKGLHQGGQVSAPVFKRVAEQVLAYMNVPHDAEIKHDPRQVLLAGEKRMLNDGVTNRVGGSPGRSWPRLVRAPRSTKEPPDRHRPGKAFEGRVLAAAGARRKRELATAGRRATNEPLHPPGSIVVQVEDGPELCGISLASRCAERSSWRNSRGSRCNATGSGVRRAQQSPPRRVTHVAPNRSRRRGFSYAGKVG